MTSFVRPSWLILAVALFSCGQGGSSAKPSETPVGATSGTAVDDPLPPLAYESAIPEALRELIGRPFTGDLDGMEARRMIRVGVTYNRTHYFVDRGAQRGLTFAYLKRFEDQLNAARKTRNFRIHVIAIPMARDRLLGALIAGQIDAVAAQWTVTPERRDVVDFSIPYRGMVNEIVVTPLGFLGSEASRNCQGGRCSSGARAVMPRVCARSTSNSRTTVGRRSRFLTRLRRSKTTISSRW